MDNRNILIAGAHSGKRVFANGRVAAQYNALKQAALKGNHWARIAVHDLNSLTSGRDKDNIYVRPHLKVAHGVEKFYMMLPGCKATIHRAPNDSYVIVALEIDSSYFEVSGGQNMTGLYKARKSRIGDWAVEYISEGELERDPGHSQEDAPVRQRIVAISDGQYEDATRAARRMAPWIAKTPIGGGGTRISAYDLHYTRSDGRLGGLLKYRQAVNPCSNQAIMGSSRMLAQTMYAAREIKGVNWVATHGGSAVLTQAMRFLSDRGIKLSNHSAYLYDPTTSPHEAVQLAHRLHLDLQREFLQTSPGNFIGFRDRLELIRSRASAEKGKNYTAGNAFYDRVYAIGGLREGGGYALTLLGAAGLAVGTPAIPVGMVVAGIFAKVGEAMWQTTSPETHEKYIGRHK